MIGIRALASYVPEGYRDNLAASKRFGQNAEYVRKNIGASRLALKSEQEETTDLGCRAVERLCESSALEMDAIDALVVVTQNPDGQGLPHTSACDLGVSRASLRLRSASAADGRIEARKPGSGRRSPLDERSPSLQLCSERGSAPGECRTLKEMERKGWISIRYRTLTIVDPARIEQFGAEESEAVQIPSR